MGRGFFIAALTAWAVISLNSARQSEAGSIFKILARCQEMASPSRSGSVARITLDAPRASLRIFSKISPRPRMVM